MRTNVVSLIGVGGGFNFQVSFFCDVMAHYSG